MTRKRWPVADSQATIQRMPRVPPTLRSRLLWAFLAPSVLFLLLAGAAGYLVSQDGFYVQGRNASGVRKSVGMSASFASPRDISTPCGKPERVL